MIHIYYSEIHNRIIEVVSEPGILLISTEDGKYNLLDLTKKQSEELLTSITYLGEV